MSDVIKRLRIILLLLIPFVVNAQEEPLKIATFYLQNGNLDSAKIVINQLVNDPQAVKDGNVWYLRGFIFYKSIYNRVGEKQ